MRGMVPYRAASEIPAFAVMDFVDGPDLLNAVRTGRVVGWSMMLGIAVDLARIVRSAHMLPERVLHRDLRPSNIMLKGFREGSNEWEVVVLDFDLSWHRDANELSVINPAAATGYLAPEQIRRGKSESTRHASVDSFGLGMTLFFLCTGQEPLFAEHQHVGWSNRLKKLFKERACKSWKSLPVRMARLVEYSTCDRQTERWDLAQIEGELQRLREANANPESVDAAELIAEELAFRSGLEDGYEWDPDAICV